MKEGREGAFRRKGMGLEAAMMRPSVSYTWYGNELRYVDTFNTQVEIRNDFREEKCVLMSFVWSLMRFRLEFGVAFEWNFV